MQQRFNDLMKQDVKPFLSERGLRQRYLKDLQEKYGAENRWTIFENKYRSIFHAFGVEFDAL